MIPKQNMLVFYSVCSEKFYISWKTSPMESCFLKRSALIVYNCFFKKDFIMSIFSCLLSMFSKELFFQDISGQLFLNIHLIAIPVGYQYCKTLDSFPECQLKLNWGFYYYFENIWHNLTSGISFNLLPSFKIERAYVRFLLMYLNIYLPPGIRPFIWENLGYQKKSCSGML